MNPTVVIAYQEFSDIAVELSVLKAINAAAVQVDNWFAPEANELVRNADALMVTIQQVPSELISRLDRCRIISRVGSGLDAIDIPAATERGIWVSNVPDYCVDEVATHAISLLLAHARRIPQLLDSTRRGEWNSKFVRPFNRLEGQTLGVLGFGRIGQKTTLKALGLGLSIVVYDPYIHPEAVEAAGAISVDLETLLRTSDFISLHMPLTSDTHQVVNANTLELMKPTAFLINTARGGLIDEDALLNAIQEKRIAGAALDVLAEEPPPSDHPFFYEEKIWLTPHIAYYSEEASQEVRVKGAEEVVRVLKGERPRTPVNEVNLEVNERLRDQLA